ncbi:MAG: DNA repair and recombination protein RadB [Methanonatronarchaeales archaeon]|nr:DNA repair and recombination protein RadB [Methanonatronarchaeales archaeon]
MRVSTGAESLDELLGGGVETSALTQVYGEGGSGKTNLAIQFAAEASEEGRVVYVDTEGFPVERFRQVAEEPDDTAERLLIFEPRSMEEQHAAVRDIDRIAEKVDLSAVIVDSVSPFYRIALRERPEVRRDLASQLTFLTGAAREHELAVLFTNQVYTDVETDRYVPLGGTMLNHLSKTVIRLEKVGHSKRRAVLEKHRSLPEGGHCVLELIEEGLRG